MFESQYWNSMWKNDHNFKNLEEKWMVRKKLKCVHIYTWERERPAYTFIK